MPSVPQIRAEIDRIDNEMVRLLGRRLALAEKIGGIKARRGERVYDPRREREVIARLARRVKAPLKESELREIYRILFRISRRHQGAFFRV